MKGINVNRLKILFGTSKPATVLTLVNFSVYGAWLIIYIVCTFIRASLFTQAQTRMAMQGQYQYTITVSSPVFAVLRVVLYILPVLALAWAIVVNREDKKAVICDKKVLIATLAVVISAAFTAFIDIGKMGLIF